MSSDTFCCCHILNGAAVVGALQLVMVSLFISNSGAIYTNWDRWLATTTGQTITTGATGRAFLQIHLANTISVHVTWTVCLAIYLLAFKTYRALFVIPNMIIQIFALLWDIIFIGAIAQAITEVTQRQIINEDQKAQLTFLVTALVIGCALWIIQLCFLTTIVKFYRYLRDQQGAAFPEGSGGNAAMNGANAEKEGITQGVA